MMMLVIKIATDVTVSSSAFAEIYIASPSGNKDIDQKQYEIKLCLLKKPVGIYSYSWPGTNSYWTERNAWFSYQFLF